VGRSLRRDDPYAGEVFGSLRGTPYPVKTDDGVRLHVEVDETEAVSDLTVVFTHGYALNQDSWHFQRRDLRGRARLVFWDQRSHGRSDRAPEDSVSFERLSLDLGQVLDEIAPDGPVILVGHSMGGMTILSLAMSRPELFGDRVAGVAMIAASARDLGDMSLGLPGPLGRVAHRVAPAVVAALARRPELVERGRRAGSDLGYVLTRRFSFVKGGSPSLVEFTALMNAATPIEVVADFLPIFSGHDGREALPVLASDPVLVVGAAGDLLTPVEHSRELAEALPDAWYVEVPDAGHMVLLERHDLVTAHLGQFVDRVRADRSPRRGRWRWWRR
jgi:pimeloyl-ACP methyl ester carboxylesterase